MSYYDTTLINSLYATRITKDGTNSCPWSPSIIYNTFISKHQVSTVVVLSVTIYILFIYFAKIPLLLECVDAPSKPYYLSNDDCIASATQPSLQIDT